MYSSNDSDTGMKEGHYSDRNDGFDEIDNFNISEDEFNNAFYAFADDNTPDPFVQQMSPDTTEPLILEIKANVDDLRPPHILGRTRSSKVAGLLGTEQIKLFIQFIVSIANDMVIDIEKIKQVTEKIFNRIISSKEGEIRSFFGLYPSGSQIDPSQLNLFHSNFFELFLQKIDRVLISHRSCVQELQNLGYLGPESLAQWSYALDNLSLEEKVLILYFIHEYAEAKKGMTFTEHTDNIDQFIKMIKNNIWRLITKSVGTFTALNSQSFQHPPPSILPYASLSQWRSLLSNSTPTDTSVVADDNTTGFVGSLLKYDEVLQESLILSETSTEVSEILIKYNVEGIKFSDVCVRLFLTDNPDWIRNRKKFLQIAFKYSVIHDYIDMVHDTTECFTDLLDIFKNLSATNVTFYDQTFNLDEETITDIKKELTKINKVMCSVSQNIIISQSHILQSEYFDKFINELKGIGIPMPALSHETNIRKDEVWEVIQKAAAVAARGTLHVTRESGPNIDKYLAPFGISSVIVKVPQNNLGAIDGCKGECDLTADQIEWNHNIAGCCQIKISSRTDSNTKTTITVSLFGDALKQMTFEVDGEITLNGVMGVMEKTALRGTTVRNNIVITSESLLRDQERKVMIMSLKTICDQRILQIMKTTHNGSTGPQLWCITTVDSYVALVNLVKFIIMVGIDCFEEKKLLTDFPKIFLTAGDFFRIREYSLNPNTEYFKKMMAILVNPTVVSEFLEATTKFIEESENFRENSLSAILLPDKILEYFRMRLFFTYTTVWKNKKNEWLAVYRQARENYAALDGLATPAAVTEILLTLSPPPSLTDVYLSTQARMDSIDNVCDSLFGHHGVVVDWTEKFKIEGDFIIIRDDAIDDTIDDNCITDLIDYRYISREMDDIFEKDDHAEEFLKIPITIELLLKLSFKFKEKNNREASENIKKRKKLYKSDIENEIDTLLKNKLQMLLYEEIDDTRTSMDAVVNLLEDPKLNVIVALSNITLPKKNSISVIPASEKIRKQNHRKSTSSKHHRPAKKITFRTSSAIKSTFRTSSAKKSTSRTSSAKKSKKSSSPKKKTPRSKDVTPRSKDVTPRLLKQKPHSRPGPSGAIGISNRRSSKKSTKGGGARRTYKKQKKYF